MIMFDKVSCQIAINPAEISEILPDRTPGWTFIRMRNGREHMVRHEFEAVLADIREHEFKAAMLP